MGVFDEIECELPLPETPEPCPGRIFQTKSFEDPYMEHYKITGDGRLLHQKWWSRDNQEWVEVPHHGDIEFGTISLHRGQFTGGVWDYRARFTEGRCTKIGLAKFSPMDPALVKRIEDDDAARNIARKAQP